ncbi:hypothetical protein BD779DRAFT_1473536 [Infundibulicybe gibba]|nr:hypothetical protein BD779DRAFT_1473536 [Infundibulicybe gibba]
MTVPGSTHSMAYNPIQPFKPGVVTVRAIRKKESQIYGCYGTYLKHCRSQHAPGIQLQFVLLQALGGGKRQNSNAMAGIGAAGVGPNQVASRSRSVGDNETTRLHTQTGGANGYPGHKSFCVVTFEGPDVLEQAWYDLFRQTVRPFLFFMQD